MSSATIQLVGNIGSEPRINETKDGKVCNLFFLVNQGKNEDAFPFEIPVWENSYTKNIIPYLKKGVKLLITGELAKPTTYNGKNGIQVRTSLKRIHTIVLLSSKKEDEEKDNNEA